ncbi:MAG: M20 family metallopeptidase [Firmicutes bacterium]|nr:M20 family metallopeptidase [Bacillota bacterium]
MTYQELKDKITEVIEKNHDELIALNFDLADHPEISAQEYETSKKIVKLLEGHGFRCEYPFAGWETAFRAISGSNNHKYKIAILAEYDALPGIGHACGHCLSGSISCLAGIALKDLQDELNADIHIIGTPAEETLGPKCNMTDDGIFDNYDMALMVHLYNQNITKVNLLALDTYFFEFHGKAAHSAASPWEGVNAFNAAQLHFHAMDMMRQHLKPDVRLHGIIKDGGKAANIVPDYVKTEVYVRSANRDYRDQVVDKVFKMAEAAALATECEFTFYQDDHAFDDMKFNPAGDLALKEVYKELNIPINGDEDALFGSSDIGNVSYACPAFHPCLQLTERDVPIHSQGFAEAVKSEKAHEVLDNGAKIIAFDIAKIFSDPERIKAMKEDFKNK